MDPLSPRLPRLLKQRAVLTFALVVALSFALTGGLLLHIARQQDEHAAEQASAFAQAAIERRREVIAKDLKDYAAWGEAYQHLHVTTDVEWAFTQNNVGSTLFTDLGYDDVAVFGPAGPATYVLGAGERVSEVPAELAGPGLAALVSAARAAAPGEAKPAVGVLPGLGAPLLVSASAITPGGDGRIVPTPGPPSVLVFADRLTPARLEEIGRQVLVQGLRAERASDAAAPGTGLALATPDGAGAILLRWDPERPGAAMLWAILPWLGLAGVAFALLVVLISRRMLGAALLIESKTLALSEAHRQMEHAAHHDAVTRLPNRVLLDQFLGEALQEAGTTGAIGVVFVDLDRFKPINDAFGHRAGDHVLQTVALRLRAAVREGDLVARVGGDEFVLAIRGDASGGRTERLCSALLETVRSPIEVEGTSVQVGLSMGVAFGPGDARGSAELLRHADIAMYAAKVGGGNRFLTFSPAMNERIAARMVFEQELRRALLDSELDLQCQPRYETQSMRLLGVEALVCWKHPARGLLAPDALAAEAEACGLGVALDRWMLRHACEAVAPLPDIAVSVSVSAAQFRSLDFVDDVRTVLAESGLPGARLELELTEAALLEDVAFAEHVTSRLKSIGVRLALGRFGTGYSSLGNLRRFPFDRLKIDQSFVAELVATSEARPVERAILGLACAMGLSVTAEGVETADQLILLRADRCDEVEGYFLSRPVAAAALRGVVAAEGQASRAVVRAPRPLDASAGVRAVA